MSLNKYLELEKQANEMLGLISTKGSGNKFDDADGKSSIDSNNLYLNECKYKSEGFISIPLKEWKKLEKQAERLSKIPIFTTIREKDGEPVFYTTLETSELGKIISKKIEHSAEDILMETLQKFQDQSETVSIKDLHLLKKIILEQLGY